MKLFSLSFPDTALLAISHQPKSSFFISFACVSTISSRPLGVPQVEAQTVFRSLIYPLSQVTSRMTSDHQYIYTYVYTHTHIYFIYIYILPLLPQNDSWTKMSYKLLKKHSFFPPQINVPSPVFPILSKVPCIQLLRSKI